MNTLLKQTFASDIYAKCLQASRRVRWEIDRDVIRGRRFDRAKKFLPDALSQVDRLEFLRPDARRLLSQIQGRTYANMLGLVERFISVQMLELSRGHGLSDQVALEALVRFTDEEIKHQELFRRIEQIAGHCTPPGYVFAPQPNEVAAAVLSKGAWAVLGLTCCIELLVLAHFQQSILADDEVSDLYRDVFLFHALEESQHAVLDELEWRREHARLDGAGIARGVDDFIALLAEMDGIVQVQARADVAYFLGNCPQHLDADRASQVGARVLSAYRRQYIASGVHDPRFVALLNAMVSPAQAARIGAAPQAILA